MRSAVGRLHEFYPAFAGLIKIKSISPALAGFVELVVQMLEELKRGDVYMKMKYRT